MSNLVAGLAGKTPFIKRRRQLTARPVEAQEATLRSLITRAAETVWGREHGYAEILKAADLVAAYQERVSLNHYDVFRPYVSRIRAGEQDILWPGAITNFAVSSGTASAGKLIPASMDMLKAMRRCGVGTMLQYAVASGDLSILGGKLLAVAGRADPTEDNPNVIAGEMTGIVARHSPAWIARFWQAVPVEIQEIDHWERKLERIAEVTIDQDIRAIAMVPTWSLVLFDRLEKLARSRGREWAGVKSVWPNLKVFFSSGVALSSYKDLLLERAGGHIDFLELYTASEGYFSCRERLEDDDMLLELDADVFYEFVKIEDMGDEHARRYTVADVEPGVRYAMHVTTCSGLWAYGMRDVIKFTSTFPHKIVVAGRATEMLDSYGEATFGDEAAEALEEACRTSGASMRSFHVVARPPLTTAPYHQWIIEFEKEPDDLNAFAVAIDEHLQKINRHYFIRREATAMELPRVVPVPPDTFRLWLNRSRKKVSAQTKVARMSADYRTADGLLGVAAEAAAAG